MALVIFLCLQISEEGNSPFTYIIVDNQTWGSYSPPSIIHFIYIGDYSNDFKCIAK